MYLSCFINIYYKIYILYLVDKMLQELQTTATNLYSGMGGLRKTMKHRRPTKTHTHGRGAFLKNWSKMGPGYHDCTVMLKKCGKKCFLGPKKSFPICARNTCKRNRKGIYAALIRAREYTRIKGSQKYRNITKNARRLLSRKKL